MVGVFKNKPNSMIEKLLGDELNIPVDNYQYSWTYTHKHEIPTIKFYNKENGSFPYGLIDQVLELFKENNIEYKIINKCPKPIFSEQDILNKDITLNGKSTSGKYHFQLEAANSAIKSHKGILNLSVSSGKTNIAAIIFKQALPHIQDNEHIIFFTQSKEIFKQTLDDFKEIFGDDLVGSFASGKLKDGKIIVAMMQSCNALLKIDPESGLKLTPKERQLKKIAFNVIPKIKQAQHKLIAYKAWLRFFTPKTKTDKKLKQFLEEIRDTSGDDKDLMHQLNSLNRKWKAVINKKAKKQLAKKTFIIDFLNSCVVSIFDECQHLTAESNYNVLINCQNCQVAFGLSGSIDPDNDLLKQRLKAIYHKIIYKRNFATNVANGVIVKPIIHFLPIYHPKDLEKYPDWLSVYDKGIVNNEYRNKLIVALTIKKIMPTKRSTLLIVNQLDHGKNLQKLFKEQGYDVKFTNGQLDKDSRQQLYEDFTNGKIKTLISSVIYDEGVSINNIKAVVMCASGKSFRQTIQRVGRSSRLGGFDDAQIFDFWDEQHRYLLKQSQARKEVYDAQGFEVHFER